MLTVWVHTPTVCTHTPIQTLKKGEKMDKPNTGKIPTNNAQEVLKEINIYLLNDGSVRMFWSDTFTSQAEVHTVLVVAIDSLMKKMQETMRIVGARNIPTIVPPYKS